MSRLFQGWLYGMMPNLQYLWKWSVFMQLHGSSQALRCSLHHYTLLCARRHPFLIQPALFHLRRCATRRLPPALRSSSPRAWCPRRRAPTTSTTPRLLASSGKRLVGRPRRERGAGAGAAAGWRRAARRCFHPIVVNVHLTTSTQTMSASTNTRRRNRQRIKACGKKANSPDSAGRHWARQRYKEHQQKLSRMHVPLLVIEHRQKASAVGPAEKQLLLPVCSASRHAVFPKA